MLDFQITDFWDWFAKNSSKLQSDNSDTSALDKLDDTISSWGLGWEIGPGLVESNSFTVSPNGNKILLEKTNKIVSRAPQLNGWEFYSAKQPKENWSKAKLFDKDFEIDATSWTYVLLKYPDNKIEILVMSENLNNLDIESKELAIDLILTNLLGEKRKIEEIDFIDLVDNFDKDENITNLQFLPVHLEKIKN